jgi:quercetin dioxygenase-like cupin family protein
MAGEARAVAVSGGERIRSPIGGDVTFVARGEDTNGATAVLELRVPPGEGPPLHRHTREDEWIHVLEGEVLWQLQDERTTTGAGAFVFVPRGVPHGFRNTGATDARMLIAFAPAGMERFFELQAELTAFDLDAFTRAAAECGMEIVGPPLSDDQP